MINLNVRFFIFLLQCNLLMYLIFFYFSFLAICLCNVYPEIRKEQIKKGNRSRPVPNKILLNWHLYGSTTCLGLKCYTLFGVGLGLGFLSYTVAFIISIFISLFFFLQKLLIIYDIKYLR